EPSLHGLDEASLFYNLRKWNFECKNLRAVSGRQAGCFDARAFEVAASVDGLGHEGQVLAQEFFCNRTQCKDVVLMQAARQFPAPHGAAPELVDIATFSHENVAYSECRSRCDSSRD